MVTESTTGSELRRLLKQGKEAPMPFAFNPGTSDREHLFLMHRSKNAEALSRTVRKEGPGSRFTYGTLTVEGKVVQLCVERPLPKLAKTLKSWLGAQGLKRNVKIVDPSGNVLEEDITDLPTEAEYEDDEAVEPQDAVGAAERKAETDSPEPSAEEDASAPEEEALRAKWEAASEKIGPLLDRVLGQGQVDDAKLKALWDLARAKAGMGDYATALKAVPAILSLLQAARAAPASDGKWAKTRAILQPKVEAALASGAPDAPKIKAVWEFALSKAADGQEPAALQAAAKLILLLKSAVGAPAGPDASPEMAKWQKVAATLGPQAEAALNSGSAEAETIRKVWTFAREQAAAGNASTALEAARRLVPLLKAAAQARPDADGDLKKIALASRNLWIDAKDAIDASIDRLISHLNKEADPELTEISEALREAFSHGLPGATGGAQTALLARLKDLETSAEPEEARKRALEAVLDYRASLDGNEFVDLCEDNPFGVSIPIRAIMGKALNGMEQTLAQ